MGLIHTVRIIDDPVSTDSLTPEHLRVAIVLRLPFRLRTGKLYRFSLSADIELFFRNDIDIPTRADEPDFHGKTVFTDAMVVFRNQSEDLEVVRSVACDENPRLPGMARSYDTLLAINEFIVAYHMATGHMLGGHPLRRLGISDVTCDQTHVMLIGSLPFTWSTERINRAFDSAHGHTARTSDAFWGNLFDFPPEALNGLAEAVLMQHRYIFHEIAFDGRARLVAKDYFAALLYAVVAMEGAHAMVLRLAIRDEIASTTDPASLDNEVERRAQKILRKPGLEGHIKRTVERLALNERPSLDELKECGRGISIRNDIMHSRIDGGKYKLRNWSNRDLLEAHQAVMKVYEKFASALAARTQ